VIDRVIAAAEARGHIVVAAAGNAGPAAPPAYPAASQGAIAVTAVDQAGRVYAHANRGDYMSMAALGVAVPAAAPNGGFTTYSGTSFAAPFVSARLAECLGRRDVGRARACIRKMEAEAKDLGAPGRDPVYGYGLLAP